MNKDEKFLKKQLEQKLSSSFDERFWDRMDREHPELTRKPGLNWLLGGSLVAALLVVFIVPNIMEENLNQKELMQVSANQELLQDYELLANLDEELMDLNDKEWDVLLAQI